jgi:hypothetical protein
MDRTLHEALAHQREDELLRQAAQAHTGEANDLRARPVLRRLLVRRRRSPVPALQATVAVECIDEC